MTLGSRRTLPVPIGETIMKLFVYTLAVIGAVFSVSALVMIYLAIWGSNDNWAPTAVVTATVGLICGIMAGSLGADYLKKDK